ncbi:hypothetical protein D3C72_2538830 [compost metagenome]
MAQPSAISPASVDSVFRALVGSTAAKRLPRKGRRMRKIKGMCVSFYGQPSQMRYENLSRFSIMVMV